MSLNKKGFVLIETLAVTIFAATIFVFLFKSVVPIMGIYDAKIDEIGNIDAVYNNYNLRKFLYNDECYNNKCDGNSDAIKNLNYTMIRCDNLYYKNRNIKTSDKSLFSTVYSQEYCNKLMEEIGGREKGSGNNYTIDHYWVFYVKGTKMDEFIDSGLNKYYQYGEAYTNNASKYSAYGTQYSEETTKLIKDTIRDFKAGKTQTNTEFSEHDSYLILYYWYINPMYLDNGDTSIPKYKDAIDILTIKNSSENLYCFKFQVIPSNNNFYRKVDRNSKYYFFYDTNYDMAKEFIGDPMEKCMKEYNGKRVSYNGTTMVLGSTTVREYCEYLRTTNYSSFNKDFSKDSQKECEEKMVDKGVSVNVITSSYNASNPQSDSITQVVLKKNPTNDNEISVTTYCDNLLRYHNQAYTVYRFTDSTIANCKHYFGSYYSISVRNGNSGANEGKVTTLKFVNNPSVLNNFCTNHFEHYNLGNLWNDFNSARIGERGFVYPNSEVTAELAIVDYDENCSKDVVIPESAYNNLKITVIGTHAFKDKRIRTVKFNNNIKIIDKDAFSGNNYYKLDKSKLSGVLVVEK